MEQINSPYFLIRACGWCRCFMGTKPTEDKRMDGEVSHGICADCMEAQKKAIMAKTFAVQFEADKGRVHLFR